MAVVPTVVDVEHDGPVAPRNRPVPPHLAAGGLLEIDVGRWQGRRYAEIVAEQGPITCPEARAFNVPPPGGEYYPAIAARLQAWLADLAPARTALVISHGITLRVLRGLVAGGRPFEGVALADDAPQGTVFRVDDGAETALHLGTGYGGMRAA